MKRSVVGYESVSHSVSSPPDAVRDTDRKVGVGQIGPAPAGRRNPEVEDRRENSLELVANADFSGGDWRGRHLSRVVFENVSFQGADLRGAVLETVIFRRCNLQGACLDGAQLRRVSGVYILAEGASLRGVQADNTQWIGCFREADFTGSSWRNSSFYSSDLRDTVGVRSFRHGKLHTVPMPDRDELVTGLQEEVSRGVSGTSLGLPARPSPSASAPGSSSAPGGDLPPGDFPPIRGPIPGLIRGTGHNR